MLFYNLRKLKVICPHPIKSYLFIVQLVVDYDEGLLHRRQQPFWKEMDLRQEDEKSLFDLVCSKNWPVVNVVVEDGGSSVVVLFRSICFIQYDVICMQIGIEGRRGKKRVSFFSLGNSILMVMVLYLLLIMKESESMAIEGRLRVI